MKRECCPDVGSHGPRCLWIGRQVEAERYRKALEKIANNINGQNDGMSSETIAEIALAAKEHDDKA